MNMRKNYIIKVFNIEVNLFYEQQFNVDVIIIEAIKEVLISKIETTRLTRVN